MMAPAVRLLDLVVGRCCPAYAAHLTERQQARIAAAIAANERHDDVGPSTSAPIRSTPAAARPDTPPDEQPPRRIHDSFQSCPDPDIPRLGRTLDQ